MVKSVIGNMKNKSLVALLLIISFVGFGQIKGKALHLDGVWRYEGGSGYEIWALNNNAEELVGSGYRLSKLGDTIKVEDLRIASVNGNYVYTLTTRQLSDSGVVINKYVFVAKRRKLDFSNTENSMPSRIRYKFNLFSKKRLKILISFEGEESITKLKLRKVDAVEPD